MSVGGRETLWGGQETVPDAEWWDVRFLSRPSYEPDATDSSEIALKEEKVPRPLMPPPLTSPPACQTYSRPPSLRPSVPLSHASLACLIFSLAPPSSRALSRVSVAQSPARVPRCVP